VQVLIGGRAGKDYGFMLNLCDECASPEEKVAAVGAIAAIGGGFQKQLSSAEI
jgi:hypothetical protein